MTKRNLTSEKKQSLDARMAGRKVINILAALLLTFIGSAAFILITDYFIFRSGTWVGWTMVAKHPSNEDVLWWQSQIGPLPPPTTTSKMARPARVRGRTGIASGSGGNAGSRLRDGLISIDMITASTWIRGGVLISTEKHVWHLGVELPGGMAFERIYIGEPGVAPKHPTYGTWDFRVLPMGLMLNSLFVAAPLFLLMIVLSRTSRRAFTRIMGLDRETRDRCEVCAYVLIEGQNPCPECGNLQQIVEQ